MNIELIKRMMDEVNENGSAKYRAYLLKKTGQAFELWMNQKLMAKFIVTGYEQGFLESNTSKTDYQIKTVASFEAYLKGQY
ncbi:hypothetical protein GHI93_00900 [Lactococcus hircilactis]|uniref:Uncharacterized protein n=1 Tax=Lactococcus hircilactis TaxID=1494462 RepID=A0A7X1Z7A1_9LACT|nr:hypothetical protein [Lactococcus hircilactis]MQW38509.1 hypothetical protein [Lactococcus hircilactis]